MNARSVILHAHFYQPPREDPWLDIVEREPSAGPHHDWNRRIERECYRTVTAARILTPDGRIARVLNTLEYISFDFGPTLMRWLEREAARTYQAILAADRAALARLGVGSALASPYHHLILPLASRSDKTTEIRWGIADFRRRFGREPAGMWLPETAADEETLDVLAAEGIRFTIVAPHQVRPVPPDGSPGTYRTRTGRRIRLFTFDAALSHALAFGPLIRNADDLVREIVSAILSPGRQLVSLAVDGETFGHHHRFGEMALAAAIEALERRTDLRIENCESVLRRGSPDFPVELVEPGSWSCPHGFERWRADCGCSSGAHPGWNQRWRAPLRRAVDMLTAEAHRVFAEDGRTCMDDPAAARDSWAQLREDPTTAAHGAVLSVRARELLEMEWHALAAATSCGWFHDDVAGIETVLVLRHAARAIQLGGPRLGDLEARFAAELGNAVSNEPGAGSAADIYRLQARPQAPAPVRVAAGHALCLEVCPGNAPPDLPAHTVSCAGEEYTFIVTDRRTGAATTVRARATATRGVDRRVTACDTTGHQWLLGLRDLAEPHRLAVTAMLRRSLVWHRLTDAERAEALEGGNLTSILDLALLRHVESLALLPDAGAIAAVADLLDLRDLLELPIPFDAQTTFIRLWQGAPALHATLAGLAHRFGLAV